MPSQCLNFQCVNLMLETGTFQLHQPLIIIPLLFSIGFLHASVGLAGGSVFSAFFSIVGVSHHIIPSLSLSLNTFNSSVGSFNYIRAGHFYFKILWPFLLGSLPTTVLGAQTSLPPFLFHCLLLFTLIVSFIRLTYVSDSHYQVDLPEHYRIPISIVIGCGLGFLSGSLGIGGGIYLIPVVLMFGFASISQAAAIGAVFILCNSVVGLISRGIEIQQNQISYILAAVIGAYIGSKFGSNIEPKKRHMLYRILSITLGLGITLLAIKIAQGDAI